jgi:Domain of unknown function (DUF4350)
MSTAMSTPSAPSRLRRARGWLLLLTLVLTAALITALFTAGRGSPDRLDPANPAPDGARALAQLLTGQGVQVVRIDRSTDLAAAAADGATIVVTSTLALGPAQLDRLAATTGPLVLIEPDDTALTRLAPPLAAADPVPAEVAAPDCSDPDARAAGPALAGGYQYRRGQVDLTFAPVFCYPGPAAGTGSYAVTRWAHRRVTVLGQGDLLTNGKLAADGNAALALRTLGQAQQVVWYLPDPLEAGTGEPVSVSDLVPPWVGWVALQAMVAVLLAIGWRARRLGPLVAEPLPVVVRAAETQLGRARLYRQSRARGRAGDTLRTAALHRLAARLAAPDDAAPAQLAGLVAAATGRPEPEVTQILLGDPPRTDAELVALAGHLDQLEHLAAQQDRLAAGTAVTTRAAATAGEQRP